MNKFILILSVVLCSLVSHAQTFNNSVATLQSNDVVVLMRKDAAGNWAYVNADPSTVAATPSQSLVKNFVAKTGISDPATVSDLSGFVNELKRYSLGTDGTNGQLVFCALLGARFNPTNQIDLLGNPYTATGTYVDDGLVCFGASGISAPMPNLTNYTVVVMMKWPKGDYYDANDVFTTGVYTNMSSIARSFVFDLVNTNDGSTFAQLRDSQYNGLVESKAAAWYPNGWWGGSNSCEELLNGQFRAVDYFGSKVFAATGSNGVHSLYESSKINRFGRGGYNGNVPTGTWTPNPDQLAGVPFNQLNVGMDNVYWTQKPHDVFTNCNLAGYVYAVMVFVGSNTNIVNGSYAAAQWLYESGDHFFLGGDSLMHQFNGAQASFIGATSATNSMGDFIRNKFPRLVLHSESSPGAQVDNCLTLQNTFAGVSAYPVTGTTLLPKAKVKRVRLVTNLYQNVLLNGGTVATATSAFTTFYQQYLNWGAEIGLVIVPSYPGLANTAAKVIALKQTEENLETNFPSASVIRWADYITPAMLANTAISRDGTHYSGTGPAAKEVNKNMAGLMFGIPWPAASVDQTVNSVTLSGTSANWTNTFSFPVDFIFKGGTVTAVTLNGTAVPVNLSGSTINVKTYGILNFANTGVPTAAWLARP